MSRTWKRLLVCAAPALVILAAAVGMAAAQGGAAPDTETRKGFVDFLKAGGVVGYTLIALSFASAALVIDSFRHIKQERLLPPLVIAEFEDLARKGRFSQIATLCKASDSMICRIIAKGLAQGAMGLVTVRQAMQEQGVKEITKLNQRTGYMGFIGSIGPMMGLLGTVLGMVSSFNVMGVSKGAARADELAVGISYALITTCEGLVVAIPMMFFHNFFRDRVTRLGQESSAVCERLLRQMTIVMEARVMAAAAKPAGAPTAAETAPAGSADAANAAPSAATTDTASTQEIFG